MKTHTEDIYTFYEWIYILVSTITLILGNIRNIYELHIIVSAQYWNKKIKVW